MTAIAESHVEEAALIWLAELGYVAANGLDIGPDGTSPSAQTTATCCSSSACAPPSRG